MRKIHRLWKWGRPIHHALLSKFGPDVFNGGPPIGLFSETEEVVSGRIEGGHISQPHSLRYDNDSEIVLAGMGQDQYADWPAVWSHRENARLLGPTMVHVDGRGRACEESMYGPHAWTDPVWKRYRRRLPERLHGSFTSIISRWNAGDSYYHWFLDGLTRLVHLDRFPPETRIIVPSNIPAFAIQSLDRLNLSHRVLACENKDLVIGDYWFAGPTMLSGCPDPTGVAWLRKKFLPQREGAATELIFVDRKQRRRTCRNAAALAERLRDRRWTIIDPGELKFAEQLEMFSKARAVVGVHGAGMTNILWMPAGGKVLEIMPSQRRNGCYAGIAACIGLTHRAWVIGSDRFANITIPLGELDTWASWLEE